MLAAIPVFVSRLNGIGLALGLGLPGWALRVLAASLAPDSEVHPNLLKSLGPDAEGRVLLFPVSRFLFLCPGELCFVRRWS
jgi:hypothetical protein